MRKLIIAALLLSCWLTAQQVNPPSGGGGAASSHHGLAATFSGNSVSAGATVYLTVPFACTINGWNITADQGTATIKLWKAATGTAVPTVSNSISTSGFSLASGTAVHSTNVSDLTTTTVSANDIIGFNLFAVSGSTYVNFVAQCD